MTVSYRPRDLLHFVRFYLRNRRRQRLWSRRFEASIRDGSFTLPSAAVVQLLPTETCNLRCPMCNQWGDHSYFQAGARRAVHMDPDHLLGLLEEIDPHASLVSVHGGEPFAYKHTETMLEAFARRPFDLIFTTNGTLLERYLEPLAELPNLALLLSIDGDEATHDAVRGAGTFARIERGLRGLMERRRARGMPLPLVIMSFVVCEHTTEALPAAYEVARQLGVFVINYNLRWFLTEEIGEAYEAHLREHFGLRSTGAWRGWISDQPDHDYRGAAATLDQLRRRHRWRLTPPFVVTTPSHLRGGDYARYFSDYLQVFGRESCFMPFYWARVHADGDLIYCPGHPDVIAGNVFRDGLEGAFNSPASVRFRKHLLEHRMPICNRCCGLYMTEPGRPHEQRVRRRLGLPRRVAVDLGPGEAH